jgi:hypothetical protein
MKGPPHQLSPTVTDHATAAIDLMNERELDNNSSLKEEDYLQCIMLNMITFDIAGANDCANRAIKRLGYDLKKRVLV